MSGKLGLIGKDSHIWLDSLPQPTLFVVLASHSLAGPTSP